MIVSTLILGVPTNPVPDVGEVSIAANSTDLVPPAYVNFFSYGPISSFDSNKISSAFLHAASIVLYAYARALPCSASETPGLSSAPDVATYKFTLDPNDELSTYCFVAAISPSYLSSSSGSGLRESISGPLIVPNPDCVAPVAGSIAFTPASEIFESTYDLFAASEFSVGVARSLILYV